MNREKSIVALLEQAKKDLPIIEEQYKNALQQQHIPDSLKIAVKRFVGDIRSALDYIAHDVYDKYSGASKDERGVYFPIDPKPGMFVKNASKKFPNLDTSNPALFNYLVDLQPDKAPENKWLLDLNEVNNDSKHHDLTEQVKKESQRVTVTVQDTISMRDGVSMSWTPANVKFGKGVSIGGVPIDPVTQMPVPDSRAKVEKVTWVDFRFKDIDVSALNLMKTSVDGVEKILTDVKKLIN